jgi:DNA-directed RNA polymerase specialized sigma24 family protein
VPEADYEVGGTRFGVFAHDWRRMDAERWLAVMGTREAAPGFDPAASEAAPVLALSQVDFTQAVRQALRDLHDPQALARNPLASARVVADRADGEPPGEVLEALLREAIAALRHPRDEKLQRVLDRTYLRPAATQEDAADLLGLPSSTYRRHLARAVERVADWLWQRELYGGD